MSLPGPIAERLGKLIPRLASEHDGEVVATVHAIRRTLANAGHSLHDLAKAVAQPETPETHVEWTGPDQWHRIEPWDRAWVLSWLSTAAWLSPRERKFVESIKIIICHGPCADLSETQVAEIDRLFLKAWEELQQ